MCSLNLGDRFAASGAVFVTGDWVDCRDLGRMVKQVRGSQECRVEEHWARALGRGLRLHLVIEEEVS